MHSTGHIHASNLARARKPPFVQGFPLSPKGTVTDEERPVLEDKARGGDQDAFRRVYHQDPGQEGKRVLRDHMHTAIVYSTFGEMNHYDRWRALEEIDDVAEGLQRGDPDLARRLLAETASTAYALFTTSTLKLGCLDLERSYENKSTYRCLLRTVTQSQLMLHRALKRLDDLNACNFGAPRRVLEGEACRAAAVENSENLGHETPQPHVGRGGSSPDSSDNQADLEAKLPDPPAPGTRTPEPDADVLQIDNPPQTSPETHPDLQALLAYEAWDFPGWRPFQPNDPLFAPLQPGPIEDESHPEYGLSFEERSDYHRKQREDRRQDLLQEAAA